MPVLGHAFVGLAIGVSTKPSARGHSEPPVLGAGSALWLPAVVTHSLRNAREAQLETARDLIEQRAYQAGLEPLARAEPWPSTTKPGRIDYVRPEAYAGMPSLPQYE